MLWIKEVEVAKSIDELMMLLSEHLSVVLVLCCVSSAHVVRLFFPLRFFAHDVTFLYIHIDPWLSLSGP